MSKHRTEVLLALVACIEKALAPERVEPYRECRLNHKGPGILGDCTDNQCPGRRLRYSWRDARRACLALGRARYMPAAKVIGQFLAADIDNDCNSDAADALSWLLNGYEPPPSFGFTINHKIEQPPVDGDQWKGGSGE